MSYIVLARKYRPQNFESVVGQNPVSQTLLNALEAGRVAHAYVFAGPRGIGKTTTARILAKCLNCEKGPTKTPCDKCEACRSITENRSLDDVLEIDGASNRGIEQIRELRESAKYAPARSRYRIFIIDEAHQITKDAFGALLKTLEEPPPHVVFMMCTTEVQKIPAPILSRCQRFTLRPISADLVLKHLKEICQKEKIKVDDAALMDIVRFVEGSLRDALSLLDQAIVFAPKGITSNTLRDLLGLLPAELIRTFAGTLLKGDPAEILKQTHQAVHDGIDLTQLAKDLQNHYHELLLVKAGVPDAFGSSDAALAEESKNFDFLTLERNIRLLSRALEDMRHSETPRAVFEVAALRLGQKSVDARTLVERLEKLQEKNARPIPILTASSSPRQGGGQEGGAVKATPPLTPPLAGRGTPTNESVTSVTNSFSHTDLIAAWPAFVNDVVAVKQPLAAALQDAKHEILHEHLILTFTSTFEQDLVKRSTDILNPLMKKRFGVFWPIETRVEKPAVPTPEHKVHGFQPGPKTAAAAPSRPEPKDEFEEIAPADAGEAAQKALQHFPGVLKKIKST